MKLRWPSSPKLPADVRAQAGLEAGERVLTFAVDDNTHVHVIATTTHLVAASGDRLVLRRPWHEVDSGQWSAEYWTLSVSWVNHSRPMQWTFRDQETRMPEAVHERVQASVVLSEPLPLQGKRQRGRVVVRKDLATDEMVIQTVLGRNTRADDPEVREAVAVLQETLRERIGMEA